MGAPNGSWNINANGFAGTLFIEGVDPQGNLLPNSTVFGNPIIGFWDDFSQRIMFMRIIASNDPSTFQIFTGYYMAGQPGIADALAGSFEAFRGTGANAQRVTYGWLGSR